MVWKSPMALPEHCNVTAKGNLFMNTLRRPFGRSSIAYGHGGCDPDGHKTNVVHIECWDEFAGKGSYRLSIESVYSRGAESPEGPLYGRVCKKCGLPFGRIQ